MLVSGQLYHVVFSNTDSSPGSNYVSVNGLDTTELYTPEEPKFTDGDWTQLYNYGSSWEIRHSTSPPNDNYTPVMQLNYADGTIFGTGYMEVWVSAPEPISGSNSVRELFTVSGTSYNVAGAGIRVVRSSGSSNLTISLEQGNGTLIDQITVPASSVGSTYAWVSGSFSGTHTLAQGQTYQLVLTAPSDTVYQTYPIRDGSYGGFSGSTVFGDGYAQFTTGSGWVGWTMWGQSNRTDGDLQFYFK